MTALNQISTTLWRHSHRIRWSVVGLLLAAAGWSFTVDHDSPEPQMVTVASRDIPSGATLRGQDVTTHADSLGLDTIPADRAAGEMARGPIKSGEPITYSRLTPGRTVELPPGQLAFPLALPKSDIASLLRSGDRIDVLATPGNPLLADAEASNSNAATILAADIEVLAIPERAGDPIVGSNSGGAIVLISVTEPQAIDLAGLAHDRSVAIAIR